MASIRHAPQAALFGAIAVFRREVPGSPIIALRGEGVVNAPILRVTSVLVDTARAPEWIDSLAETKVIRKLNDDELIQGICSRRRVFSARPSNQPALVDGHEARRWAAQPSAAKCASRVARFAAERCAERSQHDAEGCAVTRLDA